MSSALINFPLCLFLYVYFSLLQCSAFPAHLPNRAIQKRQSPIITPLVDFQVSEPVLTPSGASDQFGCIYTKLLMNYKFANSYGAPFVDEYIPPPCSFNRVTINLTVTSQGRQFDRLGLMYLGDVEVFRTSTAEPTTDGIIWTYIKEMEQYNTLWTKDQKIIFDLGNLVNDVYTGPFDTRLTVTFFTVPDSHATADTILPISAEQSGANMGSAFTVPLQNASVSYTLPPNIERAVISLSACGQIGEEFWFTNVFSSDTTTFASNPTLGTLNGYGPFREVQLLIDGQLAGVSWPFPVVFTGGIVPGLWRPIVGIDAFDLRQHEIDVTPWLSLLCNGVAHTFEIRVAGLDDDGAGHATISETVGSYWVVTGTIFLFLGASDIVSTGSTPTIDLPAPEIEISSIVTTNASGANETLTYNTTVSRDIFISSTIKTVKGSRLATWTQQLSYSNFNSLTSGGLIQATSQNTTGTDTSTSGYAKFYSYPIAVNSSFSENPAGNIGINATLSHGLTFNIFGPSIFPSGIQSFNSTSLSDVSPIGQQGLHTLQLPTRLPSFSGALLSTTQSGSASFLAAGNASYSFGTTTQDFDFKGGELSKPEATYELYHRHVVAVNSTITEDEQRLAGRTVGRPAVRPAEALVQNAIEGFSVKALLGRGPGGTKLMG